MTRAGAAAMFASLAAACSPDASVSIAKLPGASPYFFFVAVDVSSHPLRTSPVYAVENGAEALGRTPIFSVSEGETVLVLGLASLPPTFERARLGELEILRTAPPVSARTYEDGGAWFMDSALPEDVAVEIAASGPRGGSIEQTIDTLRTELLLRVPVPPMICPEVAPLVLEPFGPTAKLLPHAMRVPTEPVEPNPMDDLTDWHRFVRIIPLDGDRVLAMLRKLLLIVHRGEAIAFPASPSDFDPRDEHDVLFLESIARAQGRFEAIAIDPSSPAGELRVIVGGTVDDLPKLWEFVVGDHGIRYVTTSTIPVLPRMIATVRDVSYDLEGNTLAVGEHATVLFRAYDSGAFELHRLDNAFDSLLRKITFTYDPDEPHFVCEDAGGLHVGDARVGRWDSHMLFSREYSAVAASRDGRELWAAAHFGVALRRMTGGFWETIEPKTPEILWPCSNVNITRPALQKHLDAIAIDEHQVNFLVDDCAAVLRLDRATLCPSVVTTRGLPVENMFNHFSLAVSSDELFVGGDEGSIYSTRITP